MSSISELGSLTDKQSYFDPSEKEGPREKLWEGYYLGNITDMSVTEGVTIRGKHKADIYNFTVTVHKDNKDNTHKNKSGDEKSGADFVGREIKSNGVFNFLVPENGEFEANPGGNESFFRFCQAIGLDVPTKTIGEGDSAREVHMLPSSLSQSDCLGKAVNCYVGATKPFTNNSGETITPMKVKLFQKWEGGETMNVLEDEVPF